MDKAIRILITRQLSQEKMNRFSTFPLQFISIPFIETVYHLSDKKRVLELLRLPINTIITSQNGVIALLENFGKEILAQATWKIYCIGFATKEIIQTYFTQSIIVETAKNIDILSDKMILSDNDKFYFLGSSIRQQHWIDKLQHHHKQIEEHWVYNTVLKSQKIDCSVYQAIAFFSPSAVESFFQFNHIAQHIIVFAIGTTTAKSIQQYTEHHTIIPIKPTTDDLIITIKKYFGLVF